MSNPGYLFAVVTQFLSTLDVPQGDFYDYLVSHGAGRELQRLEQINTSLGCGMFGQLSYVLTGQCGPANSGSPAYEVSGIVVQPAAAADVADAACPTASRPTRSATATRSALVPRPGA